MTRFPDLNLIHAVRSSNIGFHVDCGVRCSVAGVVAYVTAARFPWLSLLAMALFVAAVFFMLMPASRRWPWSKPFHYPY
jgi:hypothetical protein